jgi:hypothetical protein
MSVSVATRLSVIIAFLSLLLVDFNRPFMWIESTPGYGPSVVLVPIRIGGIIISGSDGLSFKYVDSKGLCSISRSLTPGFWTEPKELNMDSRYLPTDSNLLTIEAWHGSNHNRISRYCYGSMADLRIAAVDELADLAKVDFDKAPPI